MLRAVLFDLDETLVDQKSAASEAVADWAAELGIESNDVVSRWATVSEVYYRRYQARELTFTEQRRARVREFLATDMTDGEADAVFARYLIRYEAGWSLFPDALPALRRVRSHDLCVVILTNGEDAQQRLKVTRLGLTAEIDYLIASSALPAGKPDPSAFLTALNCIGVLPHQALMVGDSLDNDVLGAQRAGLHAVLIDRSKGHCNVSVPQIASLAELSLNW